MCFKYKYKLACSTLLTIVFMVLSAHSQSDCGGKPADVVFVLDASSSIWGPNFRKQLKFVRSVVNEFDVSRDNTRCGLLTFSDHVREEFGLLTHDNKNDMREGIRRVVQTLGGTKTNEALMHLREMMSRDGRRDVPKLAIVMTDGESEFPEITREEAEQAHKDGITIFAIGIGNGVNRNELSALASQKEYVFEVDTYDALKTIRKMLAIKACAVQNDQPKSIKKPSTALKGCDGKPADVVFALDASGSIWGPDFSRQLQFVQDLVSVFQIAPGFTRIGMLTFSDRPTPKFHLNQYKTETDIKDAVGRIDQSGGNTNTADALHYMRTHSFSRKHARDGVVHIGIVITDGKSDIPELTKKQAILAKDAGIHIFAVGVGARVDKKELYDIASQPGADYVFTVNDFKALDSIKELLAMKTCEVTTTPAPTTTTISTSTIKTTTTTTTTLPLQGCGANHPADIVFSIPSTADSVDSNEAVRFIQAVTGQMDMDNGGVHIGVMPRDCFKLDGIRLNQGTDKDVVLRMLNAERHLPEDTATVIKHLRDTSFRGRNGHREGVKKIAVLIINEDSHNLRETAMEAWQARNQNDIELFVIGVGIDVSRLELNGIANMPKKKHIFTVSNFQELQVLTSPITSEINSACTR